MPNTEITPQSHGEFLQNFTSKLSRSSIARLFATQLEVTPNDKKDSILITTLTSLIEARKSGLDVRLVLDTDYTNHITRVGNRDFPNWWPLLTKDERELRRTNAASTRVWLDKLQSVGALEKIQPRIQSSAHSTPLRVLTSKHIAQHWAVVHQKGGIILSDQDPSFTLTTGNLTSSDINTMSNLAIKFSGERGKNMGEFVYKLMSPNAQLRTSGGHVWREPNDWITLIHDYNNTGDPGRLPFIHISAEKLIDPKRDEYVLDGKLTTTKPQIIVYTSQYFPDGKLAVMLNQAQSNGSKVFIPLQPIDDYRRTSFPYNLQVGASCIRRSEEDISFPMRDKPSHVKSLIVKYEDGTAAILFGSDNYWLNGKNGMFF